MSGTELIYLDYNATTPLDPRVLEAMEPYFCREFGNAASRHHALGTSAADAVDRAREQVAAVLGSDPREVVWTSGATESINLALKGLVESPVYAHKRHIITVRTEHRAVLDTCRYLEESGCQVTYLSVDHAGRVDLGELAASIRPDTLVVSAMHANNETGVLHPLREIGALCREHDVLFHTDATQSFGKEPIDVEADHVDLLSFSGHKFHGPKGVGGLFVRRRKPRVRCGALIHGGGHEDGRRSGTLNVPGIVGLGHAAMLCQAERETEQPRIRTLRDELETRLLNISPSGQIIGRQAPRLAGTTNVSFRDIDAEELISGLPGVAISTASACTSASMQPSYVLGALGLDSESVRGSLRLSLGRFTTKAEIEAAAERIAAGCAVLQGE